jgi:hypothetical protein
VARIRYTWQEAHDEASRQATEFVAKSPHYRGLRLRSCHPDSTRVQSRDSKHPLAWLAVFAIDPPGEAVIDGGELFVTVDLESNIVGVRS